MPGVLFELTPKQPESEIAESTLQTDVPEKRASGERHQPAAPSIGESHGGDNEVELLIPPPVNAYHLLQIHKKLRENHNVDILKMAGSWQGGTWMKLSLRRPMDLKEVLCQMPEVAQVWETRPEAKAFMSRTIPLPYDATEPNQRPHFVMNMAGEATQPRPIQ
ncbi:MAG: hypothetical protein O7F09_00990 [Chloroflexi bacterium]|nr:hypothetical protein [Chloroflexota bacterium]